MSEFDKASKGAKMDFATDKSYADYLSLDQILTTENPLDMAHDGLLFVIQHQTSELWMKLAIHELQAARRCLQQGNLQPAFKMLSRVARIFEQLNSAWDVLRTMTPSEYSEIRPHLGASSGFQSYQYRLVEYLLGNRNKALTKLHEHTPQPHSALVAEIAQHSLYQVAISKLCKDLGTDDLAGSPGDAAWAHMPEVQALWKQVYQSPATYWELYELAEKLVDLEDYFRRWRFNHVTTVERIIGFKRGTGGTAGVAYLRKMLEVELFPELWHVRGEL